MGAIPRSPDAWADSLRALALYGSACLMSYLVGYSAGHEFPLWFAAPVAAVALALSPRSHTLPLALAFLAIHALAALAFAALASGPRSIAGLGWLSHLARVPGPWVEAALGAWLLRRGALIHTADPREPPQLGSLVLAGVLVPAPVGAVVTALIEASYHPVGGAGMWAVWTTGALVGGITAFPLTLILLSPSRASSRIALADPRALLLGPSAAALVVVGALLLPQPFVLVSAALACVAPIAGFAATALATVWVGLTATLLISEGVLVLPAASVPWREAAYYLTLFGSLVPGVVLAASLSSRGRHQRSLALSREEVQSLYTKTPVMLHSLDAAGRIQAVSRLWLQQLGYTEEEVLGRPSTDFLTPESAHRAQHEVLPRSLLDGGCTDVEYQMVARGGRVIDVLLSAVWEFDPRGRPVRSLAVIQDVSEKKLLQQRSHYAEHDPLTGLPNRVLLLRRLSELCSGAARRQDRFAVAFLDLDRFKEINDTWGHEAGDELLREVAERLEAHVRDQDTVCRLAGDEFVVVLRNLQDVLSAHAAANKLLNALTSRPCVLRDGTGQNHILTLSSSIGLALFPEDGADPQALLERADHGMYAAKRDGRNRVVRVPAAGAEGLRLAGGRAA